MEVRKAEQPQEQPCQKLYTLIGARAGRSMPGAAAVATGQIKSVGRLYFSTPALSTIGVAAALSTSEKLMVYIRFFSS